MYVSEEAYGNPALRPFITEKVNDGDHPNHYIYNVDDQNLDSSLAPLKSVDGWNALPFTGDYDTHDMISMDSHPHQIPSESNSEAFVKNMINSAVAAVDGNREYLDTARNVVQHGPQHNYEAHMKDLEKGQPIIDAVANTSLPIVMNDRGNWLKIDDKEQLQDFYEQNGITIKERWQK